MGTKIRIGWILACFGILFGWCGQGICGNSATQVIHFEIRTVNKIELLGNPVNLIVEKDGLQSKEVTDSSTTYAITTNTTEQKITARINSPMPEGVTLKINLAAPVGALSTGDVPLSDTASTLVSGIHKKRASSLPITYRLSAGPQAAEEIGQRILTLTITR